MPAVRTGHGEGVVVGRVAAFVTGRVLGFGGFHGDDSKQITGGQEDLEHKLGQLHMVVENASGTAKSVAADAGRNIEA